METVDQDIIMNKISFFNIKVPFLLFVLTKLSMTFISTYIFALTSAHLLVPLIVFIQHLTHVY